MVIRAIYVTGVSVVKVIVTHAGHLAHPLDLLRDNFLQANWCH